MLKPQRNNLDDLLKLILDFLLSLVPAAIHSRQIVANLGFILAERGSQAVKGVKEDDVVARLEHAIEHLQACKAPQAGDQLALDVFLQLLPFGVGFDDADNVVENALPQRLLLRLLVLLLLLVLLGGIAPEARVGLDVVSVSLDIGPLVVEDLDGHDLLIGLLVLCTASRLAVAEELELLAGVPDG